MLSHTITETVQKDKSFPNTLETPTEASQSFHYYMSTCNIIAPLKSWGL